MTSNAKLGEKENISSNLTVFKNKTEAEKFKNFILNINHESNLELNKVLNEDILEKYGYCEKGSKITESRYIGLETSNKIEIKSNKLKTLKIHLDRVGYFYSFIKIITVLYKFLKNKIKSKIIIKLYYKFNVFVERLQGLEFSQIESIDNLNLQKNNSEQYETTKLFELKRWLKYIPQNIEYNAIDFGSGKGTVIIALTKIKNFQNIYGIEISKKINNIAQKNLLKKNIKDVELINIDASDTPMEIIDKCNFFYFYNPFPKNIFKSVFNKIETSFQKNNRDVIIIYFNPMHCNIIENSRFFKKPIILKNSLSTADTYIYRSYSQNQNRN